MQYGEKRVFRQHNAQVTAVPYLQTPEFVGASPEDKIDSVMIIDMRGDTDLLAARVFTWAGMSYGEWLKLPKPPVLTVAQLIEELQRYPGDALIRVQEWSDELVDVSVPDNCDAICVVNTSGHELLGRIETPAP